VIRLTAIAKLADLEILDRDAITPSEERSTHLECGAESCRTGVRFDLLLMTLSNFTQYYEHSRPAGIRG
jgi:hypothetical protein